MTKIAVVLLLVTLFGSPVVLRADTGDKGRSGQGMMGQGSMPMMQGMCQEHQEMMGMMQEMRDMMKEMAQSPAMKDKMLQRMNRMEEMMKRHEQMMGPCPRMKEKD